MNRMAHVLAHNRVLARATVLLLSLGMALLFGWLDLRMREDQRLSLLQTEAQRSSIEIMSQTLNGNLMGSITLLGLTDRDIKQEASNGLLSQDAHIPATLSTLGNAFRAEGVFVVGQDGLVKSSWDRVNKPSTGLDVKFRPYFQMALRGQNSVYAAVSMARGDRSMYFAAPVFSEHARGNTGIGAVVARTDLSSVDALLRDKFDISLLQSPQGVVFAGNRAEWIGFVDTVPTAQRLRSIRELKQFGAMFERADPQVLPLQADADFQTLGGHRYAMASAGVNWNDPSGHWRLLVLEDLGRTLPLWPSASRAAAAGVLTLLLGWMLLHLLRGRQAQALANTQLQAYAREQETQLAYRARLAAISLQFQRCHTPMALAQLFLSEARALLGAYQGVVFYRDAAAAGTVLRLLASSAASAAVPVELVQGEGLLGQCVLDGQLRVITIREDGFWNLRSGLGHTRPAALVIAPLSLQGAVQGVLELALLEPPAPSRLDELQAMVDLLALNLEILRRQARSPAPSPAHAGAEDFE
jgi:C4-dicarboxylate-specific signal transduction histidine kinase